ncbi:E3 ubiquitin-protein ligase RNF187 [Acomys russatus]|uniref:E3 ubiquitin-protein ligase RNF187 n=1 Tax=Acomys russatus TaxID=60746 RepID=UPI0021E1CC8F|nr:E3 ubiquitin-protein ligase RNF187 [Acomys russatus]
MESSQLPGPGWRREQLPGPGWRNAQLLGPGRQSARQPGPRPARARARARRWRSPGRSRRLRLVGLALRPIPGRSAPSPPAPSLAPPPAALALPAGPPEAVCALCQRAPREPVRADCGHRFCRGCVVRFWAEEDGPFPCPECADDCWQRAVEPGRPPLSRRLLALEEAAAAPARDGPASEAALQLLCRADGDPLCSACRMAAGPEPPEWEPRWRKAMRGKENKGSVEIMRKDLNDARDLHGQAESAAAVWKGHVMDRRKKALTDYKKLRAFFVEEEEHFLQEAEKDEGPSEDDEQADPAERFRSLLQAVSELEKKHRNLGLSMLLQ